MSAAPNLRLQFDLDHFHDAVAKDVAGFFVGAHLGSGESRDVFAAAQCPTQVLKIETGHSSFYNIREWDIWQEVKRGPMAKWLAPCIAISGSGIMLVQARTKPLVKTDKLPARVPAFLCDIKPSNWGWYKGRIVCHDYGHNNVIWAGLTSSLVKANWR